MSTPSLGVYVPAWNAERYIAEALESVLDQVPRDAEVVVVDDGSTDGTVAVVKSFAPRVRLLLAAHRGIGATVNACLAEMKAPLLASIDADDRWLPGKITRQMEVLESDASIDAVFGHVRQFASPDLGEQASRFSFTGEPMPGILRGVMLIRRAAQERVGVMDEGLAVGEFVSWYARAVEAGLNVKMLPDVVYERRIHGSNTVLRERDAQTDYLRILKAALDRRRRLRSS